MPDLQPWDVSYAAEQLKLAQFDFEDEQLKPYFPLPRVLGGLLQIVQRLFAVRAQERTVDCWHEDVQYFDLLDEQTGAPVAAPAWRQRLEQLKRGYVERYTELHNTYVLSQVGDGERKKLLESNQQPNSGVSGVNKKTKLPKSKRQRYIANTNTSSYNS